MVEGTLQAFLDDELDAASRAEMARHVADCAGCAAALETLRAANDRVAAALGRMDRPPTVDPQHAYAAVRARSGAAATAGDADRRTAGRGFSGAWLRAAVLVLAVAGVASAAFPGSPVRDWAASAWRFVAADRAADPPAPALEPAAAAAAAATSAGGVSVLPVDGRVRILVEEPMPDSRLRVRFVDGERAAVRLEAGAAVPRFGTSPGRIQVVGGGPGDLVVELPRSVSHAIVEVDGRPVFAKEGDEVRLLAPGADRRDTEIVLPLQH